MIRVYGKEDCKWCRLLKKELTSFGCDFEYIDIEKETKRREEYPLSHLTVPAISIKSKFIGGYDDLRSWLTNNNL